MKPFEITQATAPIEIMVRRVRQLGGTAALAMPAETMMDVPVLAHINQARWVVDCPHCKGAEIVSRTDPRFYCLSCGNADVGHRVYRVVFPADADAIQWTLLARPAAEDMNWLLSETLADLCAENISVPVEQEV